MKLSRLLLVVAAAATLASPAAAARTKDASADAVLKTAVAQPVEAVLDGRTWRCDGVLCKGYPAGAAPASQPPVQECRRVARKLGPVAAYRAGPRTLDAAALESCNAT